MKKIRVAIAGNPNAGKTTIFNNLTGGRHQVGNYPGVTVEKRTGVRKHGDYEIEFVDLPGTYGLTTWSLDEKVAREFVIKEEPDLIVDVLDASNLERNLYLTTQFIELNIPLVLAFNMSDVAKARGMEFDLKLLSASFGSPIVSMVGSKGEGTEALLDAISDTMARKASDHYPQLDYGHDLEDAIDALRPLVESDDGIRGVYAHLMDTPEGIRWLIIKLLERDIVIEGIISQDALKEELAKQSDHIERLFSDSPAILLADKRYGYISGACLEAVRNTVEIRHTASDKADAVITHRYFGMPIFLGMMYVVFSLTFKIGAPMMELLELIFQWLSSAIENVWPQGVWEPVKSLIVDGVIGGVGGVLVFLPNIVLLFMAIALLEFSGYMARAAFVVDRLMHRIGLHGKSFIPMLIGFGCSVPAIMATRMLDSRRNRLITMLIIPLMSCGARLPIYVLIIPAFFPERMHGFMMFLLYFIGLAMAVVCAKLLGLFVFKEEEPGLVMELPPYRMPTMRCILVHMWERSWLYLKKAGTIILGISVIMWALTTYPEKSVFSDDLSEEQMMAEKIEYSAAGRIGQFVEPAIKPLGFDWRIGTALIGAVAAKEVFVSQLGVVYAVGDVGEESQPLREILRDRYNALTGFCIMLFCLIGFPCVATCAVTRTESGSWKWAMFQFWGLTFLAYLVTFLVYQTGRLIGLG